MAVALDETQTGTAESATSVATASITGVTGDLYLVCAASRPSNAATGASGLGLTWTLLESQCGGRDQTLIDVFWAQGTVSGSGAVTVSYGTTVTALVAAVSKFSGVHASAPIGNTISQNTVGANDAT